MCPKNFESVRYYNLSHNKIQHVLNCTFNLGDSSVHCLSSEDKINFIGLVLGQQQKMKRKRRKFDKCGF